MDEKIIDGNVEEKEIIQIDELSPDSKKKTVFFYNFNNIGVNCNNMFDSCI